MDSWKPTDTEHLTGTPSEEGGSQGLPPEDAGYEVDEVDVVEVDGADIVDGLDGADVLVEVVEVDEVDLADEADEVAEAEAPVFDEDREVVAAPSASAPAPGTTTPEASIDEVEAVLDQVDAALARLDDGTYGRCVNCGRPIQDDRLAEDPTDQSCGECVELVLSGVD
jgi:RNA polymerase-binding transcription factor DksA